MKLFLSSNKSESGTSVCTRARHFEESQRDEMQNHETVAAAAALTVIHHENRS